MSQTNRAVDELKKEDTSQMGQSARLALRPQKRLRLRKWAWTPVAAVLLAGILVLFPILKPTTVQAQENLMEGVSA